MKPKRPENVPATAVFYPEEKDWEWKEEKFDKQGEKHGSCREWTLSGHLHGVEKWVHGTLVENKNFHPDGELSSHLTKTGEFSQVLIFFKAKCESNERWEPVAESVEKFICYSGDNGKTNYNRRCFDIDEKEVWDHNGCPIPKHPKSVPKEVQYFSHREMWILGTIKPNSNVFVGSCTWWLSDGMLFSKATISEDGHYMEYIKYVDGEVVERSTLFPNNSKKTDFRIEGDFSYEEVYDSHGNKISDYCFHTKDGTLHSRTTRTFDGQDLVSVQIRKQDGVVYEANRKPNGTLFCTFSLETGELIFSGHVKKSRLFGKWTVHDENTVFSTTSLKFKVSAEDDFRKDVTLAFFLSSVKKLKQNANPEFLKKIKRTQWYRPDKVPECLLAMATPSKHLQTQGLEAIMCHAFDYGDTFETTPLVIPLFFDLLSAKDSDKIAILDSLILFAEVAHQNIDIAINFDELRENDECGEYDDFDESWDYFVLDTVKELSNGQELLEQLLKTKAVEANLKFKEKLIVTLECIKPPNAFLNETR